MCKKIQIQLQNLIKHQISTFIARYRRVICGWNVYFGNKASSWCTDRGGPLILDDVILLFVLRILQLKLFQSNFDSYFLLHIFWDWWHSIQTNTEVFVFETFVPKKNNILLPKLFWPTVRKNCSSDREKLLKFGAESEN